MDMSKPMLEVDNLSISFTQYLKGFRQQEMNVVHNLNISITKGELLAIVGASGSGKSLLAHAILGILPSNARMTGTMNYKGEELTAARKASLRGREIALIPQSVNSLDPLMKIGKQVLTSGKTKNAIQLQKNAFKHLNLEEKVEKLYPFQLSGGMARRVLISMATVSGAQVIIADEPTPGLDEQVINGALSSLKELANNGCSVILITHDISSAMKVADKIAVFYAGTNVEVARVEDFSGKGESLRHPYTKALWRALPQNEFLPIPGAQPSGTELTHGCLFAPRCNESTPECTREQPEEKSIRGGSVRCIHAT